MYVWFIYFLSKLHSWIIRLGYTPLWTSCLRYRATIWILCMSGMQSVKKMYVLMYVCMYVVCNCTPKTKNWSEVYVTLKYMYSMYACMYVCMFVCLYISNHLEMTISYLEQHRISAVEGLDEGEEVEVSFLF